MTDGRPKTARRSRRLASFLGEVRRVPRRCQPTESTPSETAICANRSSELVLVVVVAVVLLLLLLLLLARRRY